MHLETLNKINILAKIEESTGKTIFAKAFMTELQSFNFDAVDFTLNDGMHWVFNS